MWSKNQKTDREKKNHQYHYSNGMRKIERNTSHNLLLMIGHGQFLEILKVLRRRLLNTLKFIRRIIFRVFGIYYDHPSVKKIRQQKQLMRILSRDYSWVDQENSTAKQHVVLIIRDGATHPKSSAFIRLIAPFTLEPLKSKLTFEILPENTTEAGQDVGLCVVQRNAFDSLSKAKELVSNLRAVGASLIIDSDDAFHSIDTTHPEHNIHSERLEAFNYLVEEADQVWLSTPNLASSIGKTKLSPIVIRNSLDERLWKKGKRNDLSLNQGKPLHILYMGTVSHDRDFEMVFPALDNVAKKYPNSFRLTVIGVSKDLPNRPWIKREYQKRGCSIYPRFVRWFLKQGPFDIGLSPLVSSSFNKSKSDIKCLDYLAAGIVPVVSDLEPYNTVELDNYIIRVKNTPQAWERILEDLISNTEDFRIKYDEKIKKAQSYLWTRRSSNDTSQQILKLLLNLAKRKT